MGWIDDFVAIYPPANHHYWSLPRMLDLVLLQIDTYLPVGDPKNPDKNRKTKRAVMLGARAHPRLKQKNRKSVMRNTKLLPHISESGANNSGPVAKPIRKVVTPKVATVLEQSKDLVTPPMAAE